jgi:pyridoxamine 5'-phosphate oxidase
MNSEQIAAIRQEYMLATLDESGMYANPIDQFQQWFQEAVEAETQELNALSLATVDQDHKPHNRIVLLKGIENNQFVFYTNYQSHKGQQILANPDVSLNFLWRELQRQVRIEGYATKVDESISDAYFQTRPLESQIGAWASFQSEKLSNRAALEARYTELQEKFAGQIIPRPPHWGGFAVNAHLIEFWQGRASRLHDRIVYEKADGQWHRFRLNP